MPLAWYPGAEAVEVSDVSSVVCLLCADKLSALWSLMLISQASDLHAASLLGIRCHPVLPA